MAETARAANVPLTAGRRREEWVEQIKLFACVLVVLGHFFQSMVKAQLMPECDLYLWFEQTIYTFHVPLFFICSGYLFQRFSRVGSPIAWGRNALKKLVNLGVPYLFFTTVTVAMKGLAGDFANAAGGGLLETLFLEPVAPYWYLYVLFFIFLVTPTVRTGRGLATLLAIAFAGKLVVLFVPVEMPYIVDKLLDNEVWFAGGMALAMRGSSVLARVPGGVLAVLFLVASVGAYVCGLDASWALFLLGVLGCVATLAVCYRLVGERALSFLQLAARYTMPVYLMHTIFAAGLRVVLLKLGVTALVVQLPVGLVVGFLGPVLAMLVMECLRPLDFLVYPGRYVKFGRAAMEPTCS